MIPYPKPANGSDRLCKVLQLLCGAGKPRQPRRVSGSATTPLGAVTSQSEPKEQTNMGIPHRPCHWHGRRLWIGGSSSWPRRDSAAGCFVRNERDEAKRVLPESWNGVEHAGPPSEETVKRAAAVWDHWGREEPADSGGTGRNVGSRCNWEAGQRLDGLVVQRPQSESW